MQLHQPLTCFHSRTATFFSEGAVSKHLESTTLRAEIETKRLAKELEETRGIGSHTLREAEDKLQKFKHTYTETLDDANQRYSAEIMKDREKLDVLARENDQLKGFLGEMGGQR